jgi:hypothetical protein
MEKYWGLRGWPRRRSMEIVQDFFVVVDINIILRIILRIFQGGSIKWGHVVNGRREKKS